jgi:hypothetical protein
VFTAIKNGSDRSVGLRCIGFVSRDGAEITSMERELKGVYHRAATELRRWPLRCNGKEEWSIADRGEECDRDL